jgi:tetratricopeptide (TPR) repeat protein
LRTEQTKLIEAPRPELYDLKSDPQEAANVYTPWNSAVQLLREEMATYNKSLPGIARTQEGSVTAQSVEELEALGYLGKTPGSTSVPEPSLLPDPKDRIAIHNYMHRAMVARSSDRASAREALNEVLNLEPGNYMALAQIGELELDLGEYRQAVEHLARASLAAPNDATVLYKWGEALDGCKEFSKAEEVLTKSTTIAEDRLDVRLLLSGVLVREGKLSQARDQLQAAVFLNSKSANAHLQLGSVLNQLRQYRDATLELRESLRIKPSALAYDQLEVAYRGLGDKAAARRTARTAAVLREAH